MRVYSGTNNFIELVIIFRLDNFSPKSLGMRGYQASCLQGGGQHRGDTVNKCWKQDFILMTSLDIVVIIVH